MGAGPGRLYDRHADHQITGAVVGVSDHGGRAHLVTVGADGTLLDRRRIELVGLVRASASPRVA